MNPCKDNLLIQFGQAIKCGFILRRHDFGHVLQRVAFVTRIDAFRAIPKCKISAQSQPRKISQKRAADVFQ